uniref:Uncharacterized protein n=1 Tax=Calcidiscus leptoporus TaxID=127549 RepID=A0A7S0IHY3_9EUKA|mmetsp:Transcript_10473/g.24251  ORF Transcript_10473/g.24251 Transcript_10473/m.24251 type:complete len:394 (+) Transcript_10473:391-1572(+)
MPELPTLWRAHLSCSVGTNGSCGAGMESASFFFDNRTKRLRQRLNSSLLVYWMEGSGSGRALYSQYAGDCRPMPLNFTFGQLVDFSWLPFATRLNAQAFFYTDAEAAMNYTLEIDLSRGTPSRLEALPFVNLPGTPAMTPQPRRWTFTQAEVGLPAAVWDIPRAGCLERVPPCASTGAMRRFDVYIAHPRRFVELGDQDSADARGDVAFLCPDLTSAENSTNGYDTVSHWVVEMNAAWGQYRQCNGYPGLCVGLETFFVGRQVPFGDEELPLSGQCSPHTIRGSWFSHPAGGQCKESSNERCSWRPVRRAKSISIDCLARQQGLVAACRKDLKEHGDMRLKQWIYNRSLPIFERAFMSDGAAQGGCPPLKLAAAPDTRQRLSGNSDNAVAANA